MKHEGQLKLPVYGFNILVKMPVHGVGFLIQMHGTCPRLKWHEMV